MKSERVYVYDGLKIDWNQWRGYRMENLRNNQDLGTEMETKVAVMREFKNSEANHLGMPLPKGRVRFYKMKKKIPTKSSIATYPSSASNAALNPVPFISIFEVQV